MFNVYVTKPKTCGKIKHNPFVINLNTVFYAKGVACRFYRNRVPITVNAVGKGTDKIIFDFIFRIQKSGIKRNVRFCSLRLRNKIFFFQAKHKTSYAVFQRQKVGGRYLRGEFALQSFVTKTNSVQRRNKQQRRHFDLICVGVRCNGSLRRHGFTTQK